MASHKENSTFYVVTFRDPEQNKTVTLKAQSIGDSSLGLSFIKIADFIFDTKSKLIKPSEEQMAKKFEFVKSLHLSIYNVISIEEVGMEHKGLSFERDRSNLVLFPKEPNQ